MREWDFALRRRLAGLRLPPAHEATIVEELSQHLDDHCDELIAGGVAPDEAKRLTIDEIDRANLLAPRLAALRQSTPRQISPPGAPGRSLSSGFWQDLRHAVRTLRHQSGFSIVAIATLALGIGLNTSMFSFLNALLLRPLPFPKADELVRLYRATPHDRYGRFSPADYRGLTQNASGFGRVAAYQPSTLAIADAGRSSDWLLASANLLDVLGLSPEMGRFFRPEEEIRGNDRVVVISHVLWQNRFGGAADVIGQTIRTNDQAYEIIGVLPPAATDHRLLGHMALVSPMTASDDAMDRGPHTISILGRRDSAMSDAQAAAFISAFGARLASEFPAANAGSEWRSEPLPESDTGPTGRAILFMLLGLSGFVLLIACSNLANLLLARTIERTREFAVRTALGASRLQLIRILTLESLVLAIAGGSAALAVASWTTSWLNSVLMNGGTPVLDFSLDWRVLSFSSATSALTVVFCALAPALFTGRLSANEVLKSGGRGTTGTRGHTRVRYALIAGQFALAMILLAGAGFFLRGASNALARDHGWSADGVLQGEIALPEVTYAGDAAIASFHRRLIDRVRQVPGVGSASVSYGLPFLGLRGFGRYIGDRQEGAPSAQAVPALINGITPSYFEVTRTRVIAGRPFTDADTLASPNVAIVSESMARALFPDGAALGRRVREDATSSHPWMEVVGIVEDVTPIDVAQQPTRLQLYQPAAQDLRAGFVLAVRTSGIAPGSLAPAIRQAIADLDPNLPVRQLMAATTRMEEITSQMFLVQQLLFAFAVLGLFLAAVGIYGAMTRLVVQRTDEIGLRMALGAQVTNVIGVVLGSAARIVGIGATIGLLGAIGLSRLLASVLPSMESDDAIVGAAAAMLLVVIALLACYLPARRAAHVDPIVALRSE
jgi:putative ABC transport system permease protein